MRERSESEGKKWKKTKLAAKIILGIVAIFFCTALSVTMLQFVAEPVRMETWMQAHPCLGRLAYAGMAFLQVVIALIPGEPVEIAGGYIFGAWQGTLLYLAGSTIGSVGIFVFVRRFGYRLVELFFSMEKIKSLRFLKHSRKRNALLVFIFILPGTPKDLLCYFAGLTDISFWWWLPVCSLGRLPSLVSSVMGGDALETRNYLGAGIVFIVTFLLSGMGLLIYRYICKKHDKSEHS